MPSPVAIVSLDRGGVAVLQAEARSGGLSVVTLEEESGSALTPQGHPAKRAGDLVGRVCREIGVEQAYLVLPTGTTIRRRAVVDVPEVGNLNAGAIRAAVEQANLAFARPGEAILSSRPYAYDGDGQATTDAPIGSRFEHLTVSVASASASLTMLAAFDSTFQSGGITLAGVVSNADAIAAALLDDRSGTLLHVTRDETQLIATVGDVVTGQALVPIGRRHFEGDLAQAFALEPAEAARRADAVLSGTSSDDRAADVVAERLAELADLLRAAAVPMGVEIANPLLSGLPPKAAPALFDALPADRRALPPALRTHPSLAGAAFLTLGLRGSLDHAVVPAQAKPSRLSWLTSRF